MIPKETRKLLHDHYNCTITPLKDNNIRLNFIYNADAATIAKYLIIQEIEFHYVTDEIYMDLEDLPALIDEIEELWL